MPKEVLNYDQTKFYLSGGDLRLLNHHVDYNGHSETVYEILSIPRRPDVIPVPLIRQCDTCKSWSKFMQRTIDHRGQNFLALVCESHATRGLNELAEKAAYG